jgi:octanoyl-[GcvH]:protein N-octanoyltransferase
MLEAARTRVDSFQCLIWQCAPCIVVPRRMSMLERFPRAAALMQEHGFPMFVRETGGDAVVQGPGIINVTIAFTPSDRQRDRIHTTYERLSRPLINLLLRQGIRATTGAISGAMCDGAYNVVVGRRKLAGTAQRWRTWRSEDGLLQYAVLAHLALSVDVDHVAACAAINTLYAELGIGARICSDRHANWADIHPAPDRAARARLISDLGRAYRETRHDFSERGRQPEPPAEINT